MLLLLLPQGTPVAGVDVAASVADAVYRLGLQGPGDLAGRSWVSLTELYEWADEAVKRLAFQTGLFVERVAGIAVQPGYATYSTPSDHVATIHVSVDDVPLRATPVRDLWARDAQWQASTGTPTRFSMDAAGLNTITIYPCPVLSGELAAIYRRTPGVRLYLSVLPIPSVLADCFTYAALAGARGKESDGAMPEMAAHFGERVSLYQQIVEQLW